MTNEPRSPERAERWYATAGRATHGPLVQRTSSPTTWTTPGYSQLFGAETPPIEQFSARMIPNMTQTPESRTELDPVAGVLFVVAVIFFSGSSSAGAWAATTAATIAVTTTTTPTARWGQARWGQASNRRDNGPEHTAPVTVVARVCASPVLATPSRHYGWHVSGGAFPR